MKTNFKPESSEDIHKVVYDVLKSSKALDVFPTPVEKIVSYAELLVKDGGLHNIPNHYISKTIDKLKRLLSNVYGALDRRNKIVYLNPDMTDGKKNFVQLHEVGHHTLPWQHATFEYVEDELSLDPYVLELFESEANYFASAALFQLDRFDSDSKHLPLEIASVRLLSEKFGASLQASFRRYVENLHKRAALLVLKKPSVIGGPLQLRNWFTSKQFDSCFGDIDIPEQFASAWPFVRDYENKRRWIDDPQSFKLAVDGENTNFEYRYFFNGHNIFVLITPCGERIASKTTILVSR